MIEVEPLLDQARQLTVKIERPATRATNLNWTAEVYLKFGDNTSGIDVLSEVLKILDTLKHPDEKAKQLAWAARLYSKSGDSIKAGELFARAKLLSGAVETSLQQADALYNLAGEYADSGLPENAAKILAELNEFIIDPQNNLDMACELINMAELYLDIDQNDQAQRTLEKAVEIASALKDSWFKTERLMEAAEIYSDLGHPDIAAGLLDTAVAIANNIDEVNRLNFLLTVIDIHITNGSPAKAREVLEKVISIANRHPENPSAPADWIEIARDYARLDEKEVSKETLITVQRLIERLENIKDRISGLIDLSLAFQDLGQKEKSREIADQALAGGLSLQDKKSLPFIWGNLAVLYVKLKNSGKAEELVERIRQLVIEAPTKTTGLGSIINDLSEIGEYSLALKLTDVIREPEVKSGALIMLADNLIEASFPAK